MAYVFDTTAVVAYFKDEPAADEIEGLLGQPSSIVLPFMTVMEAQYVLARTYPAQEVSHFIAVLRASDAAIIESTPAWGAAAAQLKARGGLSLADAWIASLALMQDAELVHADPEFDRVEGLRSYRLP